VGVDDRVSLLPSLPGTPSPELLRTMLGERLCEEERLKRAGSLGGEEARASLSLELKMVVSERERSEWPRASMFATDLRTMLCRWPILTTNIRQQME